MNPPVTEAVADALREPRMPAESRRLPIFVSVDGRRSRVLKLAGRVVVGLTALWLVALLAGATGVGRLPGVPLPEAGSGDSGATPAAASHGTSAAEQVGRSAESAAGATPHAANPSRRDGSTSHTSDRRGGSPAAPPSGRVGTHRGKPTQPQRSVAGEIRAPGPSTPPGRSGTAPGRSESGSYGTGPPLERTDSPGATKAQQNPRATENSPRWSAPGG